MQHCIDDRYVLIVIGFKYSIPNLRISSLEHRRMIVKRASSDNVQSDSSNSRRVPLTVSQNTESSSHSFAGRLNGKN